MYGLYPAGAIGGLMSFAVTLSGSNYHKPPNFPHCIAFHIFVKMVELVTSDVVVRLIVASPSHG